MSVPLALKRGARTLPRALADAGAQGSATVLLEHREIRPQREAHRVAVAVGAPHADATARTADLCEVLALEVVVPGVVLILFGTTYTMTVQYARLVWGGSV